MADLLIAIAQILIEIVSIVLSLVVEAVTTITAMFGSGLSLVEFLILLPVFLIELIYWLALSLLGILKGIVTFSKPKRVKWPSIWRPKSIRDSKQPNNEKDQLS